MTTERQRRVYLDYSAASPIDERVLQAMRPFLTGVQGNPSSLHEDGRDAMKLLERCRETVAGFVGARKEELIFTSCGTESNNLAIRGVANALKSKGNHIVISGIEHVSVRDTALELKGDGFEVTEVKPDRYGIVHPDAVSNAITPKTILASIQYANHEIGTIQPLNDLVKAVKSHGVLFHTDAVAAAGKVSIDVNRGAVDLLSFASNDIYGPKGVAALYVRKGTPMKPLTTGGGQERRIRPGTENLPGIIGFAKACELASAEMDSDMGRIRKMRDSLIDGLTGRIYESHLNGHRDKRVATNANVRFSWIEGESMLLNLDMLGISVSSGSACTSRSLEPSHVLLAIGLRHEEAHGSIQFTLGRWTKQEDIDYVIEQMPPIVKRLREMSPIVPEEAKGLL